MRRKGLRGSTSPGRRFVFFPGRNYLKSARIASLLQQFAEEYLAVFAPEPL